MSYNSRIIGINGGNIMSKCRVLVAEDESIVAMDLKSRLFMMGYDVTSVVNNALEVIQKTDEEKPDIILMDILLSGMLDGIEAAKIISYKHNVPIIYLSALNDEQTIKRANINSYSMFIGKPYRDKDLKNAIEIMLSRRINFNRNSPPTAVV